MKPFQFLAEAREPVSARELGERARRAEAAGYHALVIPDHLLDQLSPVPAMAVIAAAGQCGRAPGRAVMPVGILSGTHA